MEESEIELRLKTSKHKSEKTHQLAFWGRI